MGIDELPIINSEFIYRVNVKKRKILSNYPLLSNRARDRTRTYTSQNTRS